MSVKIIVSKSEHSKTLGEVLSARGVSRRLVVRLKRTDGGMTRNGETIRTVDRVCENEVIELCERDEKQLEPNPELCVEILFEDEYIIVFNKPPLMPVHPSIKHQGDTLGNFFTAHCPGLTFRPVNRLDRDTSGCVVAAKNQFSAQALQNCCDKTYMAVCHGRPPKEGRIDLPIAREKESIIKRCVSPNGQRAVTNYKVIGGDGKYSLCEIKLETGRTHQIRVHFSYMGYPLAGDDMYGGEREVFSRQALHCGEISFVHPVSGENVTVSAGYPDDFLAWQSGALFSRL